VEVRLPRVQGHAHLQRRLGGPRFGTEGLLEGAGAGNRGGSTGEDGEEAVPFAAALDQRAAMLVDALRQQRIVTGESRPHRLGLLLPEPCAPFDIRQEEGDGAGGKLEARSSKLGAGPRHGQTTPLWGYAVALLRASSLELRAVAQRLKQRHRLRIGRHGQLSMQAQPQLPVDLQCCGVAPARRQRPHPGALTALPQRVHRHRPPQVAFRFQSLPRRQCPFRQALQRPQIGLLARLSLGEHPRLGTLLEQRPPVERYRPR
jgi:hypothetical protein